METIEKHKKRLLEPYIRSRNATEIIDSAKQLALAVLSSEKLLTRHRKKMLSEVLWLISEADGKYSTRYRSAEVIRLAKDEPNSLEKIQHEHVFPRKKVTEKILYEREELVKNPDRLFEILEETIGCVVTANEHKKLNNALDGWNRYEKVEVLDMLEIPPSPLPQKHL